MDHKEFGCDRSLAMIRAWCQNFRQFTKLKAKLRLTVNKKDVRIKKTK